MEDTKSLLVVVLQKIFYDRPKVVEDTYQLIYNYNNGKKEKNEYERTLKTICDLMNDELPSEILVYLLTLVDMPQEDGTQLPIMEKIQKTYSCLTESVRPLLLECLRKKPDEKLTSCSENTKEGETKLEDSLLVEKSTKKEEMKSPNLNSEPLKCSIETKDNETENKFVKPKIKRTRSKRKIGKDNNSADCSDENGETIKTLQDITASYVIVNEKKLKHMYKTKLIDAWKMINSNAYCGSTLSQCYAAVRDLNKKAKLLRCIENDNITEDIFMDEYENSEILLKERNMFHEVNKDPFILTDELVTEMKQIVNN